MSGTVIVGLDGTAAAATALRWAWDLARETGRELRVVHTWRIDAPPVYAPVGELRRDEEQAARRSAAQWMAAAITDDGSVRWHLEVVEGAAAPTLVAVAAAQESCVLVVGTQEHHGLGRLLHGSVSHYVVSHAGCPVVAVPPMSPGRVTIYPDPSELAVTEPHVPRF